MSREEHKNAIEVSVIFHEGQRMFAVPKQSAQQEPMDEIRCPECGYLTKHTEHIGCLRNQLNAINAFEQRNFAIVNMDKFPPAQRKPLTDEEIRNIWSNGDCFEEIAFARAIEAAHGIGEKK